MNRRLLTGAVILACSCVVINVCYACIDIDIYIDGYGKKYVEVSGPGNLNKFELQAIVYEDTGPADEETWEWWFPGALDGEVTAVDPNYSTAEVWSDTAGIYYPVKAEAEHEDGMSDDYDWVYVYVVEVEEVIGSKYVLAVGEEWTYAANTNPVNCHGNVDFTWDTDGGDYSLSSGTSLCTVSWDTPGAKTLTAHCGASEVSKEITVYEVELKSVDFTSDHDLLLHNDANWSDTGTDYNEPEWKVSPSTNDPITHTMNTSLTVNVTVKVSPSGLSFDLIGDSPNNYVDFTKTGNTSTGADQTIPITANAALPYYIDTLEKSIDWTIKLVDPSPDIEESVGSSGPHKIYLTYGTPDTTSASANKLTDMRIIWSCDAANGAFTRKGIADSIYTVLSSSDPPLEPGESLADPNQTTYEWKLLYEDPNNVYNSPYYGECDEQAELMRKALDLLGVTGSDWKNILASDDNDPLPPPDFKWVDEKKYFLKFDFDQDGKFDNNYEACVKVPTNDEQTTFHWYAVYPPLDAPTACDIWRKVGPDGPNPPNAYQVWVFSPNGLFTGATWDKEHLPDDEDYVSCD